MFLIFNTGTSPLQSLIEVRSIPATFILDENGRIIAKNLRGSALEQKLENCLATDGISRIFLKLKRQQLRFPSKEPRVNPASTTTLGTNAMVESNPETALQNGLYAQYYPFVFHPIWCKSNRVRLKYNPARESEKSNIIFISGYNNTALKTTPETAPLAPTAV